MNRPTSIRNLYTSKYSPIVASYTPLTRYEILRVAHAPEMPGTFSPPPTSKETAGKRSRHTSRHVRDARAVMHVAITNVPGIPDHKRSRHSRRMRNPQFHVSSKRPMLAMYRSKARSVTAYPIKYAHRFMNRDSKFAPSQ